MDEIEKRRRHTAETLKKLREQLAPKARPGAKDACVYVIGSYGRGEASEHSDLDLFIVGRSSERQDAQPPKRMFGQLEEILLKGQLIEVAESLRLPKFSGDGEFLTHYPVHQLIGNLGTPEDDSTNTLTARLLLLLESQPVLGDDVYDEAIDSVLTAYWRNYDSHKTDFVPGYLVNDILRLWRTFCVNYEARTKEEPAEKQAKRQLKHYKLQHSRLLTCYSGLLYLLGEYGRSGTVSLEAARDMTRLTPLGRLDWIGKEFSTARSQVDGVKNAYAAFLEKTHAPESEIIAEIIAKGRPGALPESQPLLSETAFHLINLIGEGNRLHRLIVV